MWAYFCQLWTTLAKEVQAALIAATVPLLGVILTIGCSTWILRRQLRQDEEHKNRDRTQSLKLNVFLEAGAAVPQSGLLIGRMSDLSISDQMLLESYANCTSAFTKAQIVAGEASLKAILEYTKILAEMFVVLMVKRRDLVAIQASINQILEQRENGERLLQQAVRDGMSQDLINVILHGNDRRERANSPLLDEFQRQFENGVNQIRQDAAEFTTHSQPALMSALVEVRKELDLTTDAGHYLGVVQDSLAANRNAFR